MTTTWQDIQATENDIECDWSGYTRNELKKLRKDFMQDARDARRWGSYADALSYECDIEDIEQVLAWLDQDFSDVVRYD